jgi:hypothetical protein
MAALLAALLADPALAAATAAAGLLLLWLLVLRPAAARKALVAPAPPRVRRGYTATEVAAHAREDDLWLIIRGDGGRGAPKVYDVTDYVEVHPGGEAILAHAGGDATAGFFGPQHPSTAFELVEEFCIGWVVGGGEVAGE